VAIRDRRRHRSTRFGALRRSRRRRAACTKAGGGSVVSIHPIKTLCSTPRPARKTQPANRITGQMTVWWTARKRPRAENSESLSTNQQMLDRRGETEGVSQMGLAKRVPQSTQHRLAD
jgi:hypothetical protein